MLVVIAEKEELKLVEELGYGDFPILITGAGGINVIQTLKNLPKDTEILNIGYCGSNHYKIGEKLMISSVCTQRSIAIIKEKKLKCKFHKHYKTTTCYTSTDFVVDTNKVIPCVFDMELAFIRAMFDNVMSIKVVSDNLNYKEFKENQK